MSHPSLFSLLSLFHTSFHFATRMIFPRFKADTSVAWLEQTHGLHCPRITMEILNPACDTIMTPVQLGSLLFSPLTPFSVQSPRPSWTPRNVLLPQTKMSGSIYSSSHTCFPLLRIYLSHRICS